MATNVKRRVALKGQSRSKFCGLPTTRSKTSDPCLRLAGHKGKHRPTTFRHPKDAPTIVGNTVLTTEGRVEITPDIAAAMADAEATAKPSSRKPVTKSPSRKRRPARRRLSKTAAGRLAQAVEDGTVKPSEALSRVAASQRGRRNRPVRVA